jgi:hypothetical protein
MAGLAFLSEQGADLRLEEIGVSGTLPERCGSQEDNAAAHGSHS